MAFKRIIEQWLPTPGRVRRGFTGWHRATFGFASGAGSRTILEPGKVYEARGPHFTSVFRFGQYIVERHEDEHGKIWGHEWRMLVEYLAAEAMVYEKAIMSVSVKASRRNTVYRPVTDLLLYLHLAYKYPSFEKVLHELRATRDKD